VKIAPKPESLSQAMEALSALLREAGCAPRVRMALETVVEEVFMNIALHSGATDVDFTLRLAGDEIVLRFEDDGAPFDPLALPPPDTTLPAEQREIGGLGVMMVRRLTDRQTYARESGRNVFTLGKRLA
jgi:anti-sigma regulatory factor (Ser/Thr protein kinase)